MPRITEAQAEKMADVIVSRKLSTDPAYQNAETAEAQATREDVIAAAVWSDLEDTYDII
jgi:hypothetical protein